MRYVRHRVLSSDSVHAALKNFLINGKMKEIFCMYSVSVGGAYKLNQLRHHD